jgi:5,10-methylenetetrahydromethanopterin reductase
MGLVEQFLKPGGLEMKFCLQTKGPHSKSDLIDIVQECELAGFESFLHADERFYLETYSTLTVCAEHTRRIRLGPSVTDPYSRHPALTAMAIGTLDHYSEGRAQLGIGAGNSGFRELQIKRIHPAQAIRESIQVVRALLAGETVTIEGKIIRLKDCKLNFEPRGPVPIIVGSNGQLIIKLAAEIADGVVSSSVLVEPRIGEVFELVEKGLQTSGRKRSDFRVYSRLNIAIHTDPEAAYMALKPMIYNLICGKYPDTGMFDRMGLPLPEDLRHTVESVGRTFDHDKLSWIVNQIPDEYIENTCLGTTPQKVIDQLHKLQKAGFDGVFFYPLPTEDQTFPELLDIITRQVVPAFKNETSAGN